MLDRLSRALFAGAIAVALAASVSTSASAQSPTIIIGRVVSAAGAPVGGATVLLEATQYGTVSGTDGRYSLTVPATRTGAANLTARLFGYRIMRQAVNLDGSRQTIDWTLTPQVTQLNEVVVTALSQQREKATIGTAQQQVSGDELTRTQTPSIINSMSGKVAGLQISQSGNMGGSARIVIRGAGSILGQNQPLFIVDGIAVSNANFSTASASGSGSGATPGARDYGSAISDLNQDDIATVTVLKGPNAAALYGSRASNGAIVITTKGARNTERGTKFSFSSRATADQPSMLPSYQNRYGQGFGGEFLYVNGAGDGVNDGADESWGPKLDGRTNGCIYMRDKDGERIQPLTYNKSVGCDQFHGKSQPWIAHPDNVKNFFRTGSTLSNNINVSTSGDVGGARLSLTKDDIRGIVPNTSLSKLAGSLSANATVKEKLRLSSSMQYTQLSGLNRPENGYTEGNPLMSFTWFGRQVDIQSLKSKFYNDDTSPYGFKPGSLYNWNDNYRRNPYWQFMENPAADSRDRIIAQMTAEYAFLPWLRGLVRGGGDSYRQTTEEQFAKGNIDRASASFNGGFNNSTTRAREVNVEGLLTARHSTSMFDFTANVGGNRRRNDQYNAAFGTSGILVPKIYNLSNAGIAPTISNAEFHSAINSAYGSAVATMNKAWTVEVTGRNDWSSTLPKENASYFYPSISSSLIVSDLLPSITSSGIVNYLKLRGGWARVGADAGAYQLQTLFIGNSSKFNGNPLYGLSNSSANAALKPEQTTGTEGGVELAMFDDRITLDATYYYMASRNQILPLSIAPATGFSSTIINAGQISNRGFEASLTARPVRLSNGFQWTTTLNYNKNKSRVDELATGLSFITIPGGQWGTSLQARVGEPYGQLFGPAFKRDSATGQLLLDRGLPQKAAQNKVLGNVNPDWVGGWANDFRYKSVSLNTLLDVRRGGETFSIGNMWGSYAGVLDHTLAGREVDWNNPGLVIQGLNDVAARTPNTTNVTTEKYWHSIFPITEGYIYNSGFVKLREVRLSWEVPARFASSLRMDQMNLALVGRNLLTWTDYPNYDPENATNSGNAGQGFEMGGMPTTRTFGINLTVTP